MDKKGSALIMTYAVILILIFLGMAFIQQSISETAQVTRFARTIQAFWLAEEGIQRGFYELNYGGGAGSYLGTENGVGDWNATVVSTGTDTRTITATGSVPGRTSLSKITRSITVTAERVYIPIFRYAGFGKQSVTLTNIASTDSYDSDLGAYGNGNVGADGDVGTNGGTVGAVTLSNAAAIHGDVNTGPGGTVILNNSSTVSGATSHTSNEAYPPVEVPESLRNKSSEGSIDLQNVATRTITGDHQYTSISLKNTSQLNITGTTRIFVTSTTSALDFANSTQLNIAEGANLTIYVQGQAAFGNSVVINNVSQEPQNFILYSSYTGSKGVVLQNSGATFGAIYAPDTSVALENSYDVFGSVIGKTLTLPNGAKIHYDEALGRLLSASVPSGEFTIQTWVEN